MNTKLIVSDIHTQLWYEKNISYFKEKIKTIIRFGFLNNNKNVDLIIPGDFINIFKDSYHKNGLKNDNTIKDSLELFLDIINEVIAEEGKELKNIFYVYGNHEYCFDMNYFNDFNVFKDSYSNFPLCSILENIMINKYKNNGIKIIDLNSRSYLENNELFVGNILYNGIFNIQEIVNKEHSPFYNSMLNGILDFSYIYKYTQSISNNIPKLFEKIKGINETIDRLIDSFYFYTKELNLLNGNIYTAASLFLFHYLTIIERIYINKDNNVKYLNIITHFPFMYEYDPNFKKVINIEKEDRLKYNREFGLSPITKYFNVDLSFFTFLLEFVNKEFKQLEQINFFSGHTHNGLKFSGKYNNKKVNIINNCIGYPQDF